MFNGYPAYLNLLFSHGLTTAVTLYLAVRGGVWLDNRFGTSPLFLALLSVLVVVANLHLLIKDIMAEVNRPRPPRRSLWRKTPPGNQDETDRNGSDRSRQDPRDGGPRGDGGA